MAQVYNPDTGEWEEKPDEGTLPNMASTGGVTGSTGTGQASSVTAMPSYLNYSDWQKSTALPIPENLTVSPGDAGWTQIYGGDTWIDPTGWISTASPQSYQLTPEQWTAKNPSETSWVSSDIYKYATDYASTAGLTQDQLTNILKGYGTYHSNAFGGWSDQDSKAPAALAWSAFSHDGVNNGMSPQSIESLYNTTHNDPAWNSQLNQAITYGNQKAAANHSSGLGEYALPLLIAAGIGTGGFGLFGGTGGGIGAAGGLEGLAAADAAAGLLPEFGSITAYEAGLGALTNPIIDYGSGIESLLGGDPSYWPSSLGSELSIPNVAAAPESIVNMEQGFRELSQLNNSTGWNNSPLNPEVSALENTGSTSLNDIIEPKQFIDDAGVGTNAAGDMVNAKGQRAWQDVMSEKLRPTLGIDGAGSTVNGLSNAWTKLTTPIGGNKMSDGGILSKLFKAPTPLELGVRGLGSLDSWIQGKKAQDVMEEQINRMRGAEDSNAARGTAANDMWLRTQQDPTYGYDTFMQGAGKDFVNQARAAAAKSGNRGSYLNSGRMMSDLSSLWQKNQTQRASSIAGGFSSSPYSSSSSMTPGYANLIKNQNAPLFQGLSGAIQGFKLADLFGGD